LPLNIDTAAAIRRPADQEALVRAVLAADPTDESYWLEWKSRVDLSTAEGRFTVAKGILGMANRHPDRAARTVEGCGYLLVGAEPNNLVGLTPVDGADLDNQLRRFLGQQGPQWYPTWIPINGTHVLLVTVEPPRWSDPIHLLHRDHGNCEVGMVFVRRGSSTARANPVEMAYLQERVARRADRVRVELTLPTPGHIQPVDLRLDPVDTWVDAEREALVAPLERHFARQSAAATPIDLDRPRQEGDQELVATLTPRQLRELRVRHDHGEELTPTEQEQLAAGQAVMRAAGAGTRRFAAAAMGYEPEDRTPEAYLDEVEAYLTATREAAVHNAVTTAVRDGVGRLQPVATNPTERNFTSILIEVQLDAPVLALDVEDYEDASPEPKLPTRPRQWGMARRSGWLSSQLPQSMIRLRPVVGPLLGPTFTPTVPLGREVSIEQGPPCRIRWKVDHLPPRGSVNLDPICVLIRPEYAGQTVTARWTTSARDADGVVAGTLSITIGTTLVTIAPLLEQRVDPDRAEG
jgi:hypothetical protein